MANESRGQHTLAEILNQSNAWSDTIDVVGAKSQQLLDLLEGVGEVVFAGCGSALNISCVLAPVFQHLTGTRARAVPAADVVFYPDTVFAPGNEYLLVLISRSGETTETVMASEIGRARGMGTLSLSCYQDSALAQSTDESIILDAAGEESVTTTQSLTSMILAGQLLAGHAASDSAYLDQLNMLPPLGGKVVGEFHQFGRGIAENAAITKFAFVGNGPFYGLARECQLKVKEMVLLPADAYPLMDYRHGPKSNVDGNMLVTVLLSDSARPVELEFIREMKSLGGYVQVICDQADAEIENLADYLVVIDSGLPDFARGILYMPPVHFLAYYKSLFVGQDPDHPANLSYWVETKRR